MMEIYLRQSCDHNTLISLILKETEELKLDIKKYIFFGHRSYDIGLGLVSMKNSPAPFIEGRWSLPQEPNL